MPNIEEVINRLRGETTGHHDTREHWIAVRVSDVEAVITALEDAWAASQTAPRKPTRKRAASPIP